MHLYMAVPMKILAAVADFCSQIYVVLQQEQTSVVNTVYCQRKNLAVVSLKPAIKFFPVVVDTYQK